MSTPRVSELATELAEILEAQAEDLVEEWIEWIRGRVGTRTIAALPVQALRNHVPPVIAALARFLRTPSTAAGDDMLGHLKLHAQVRRDQGYDIQELLAEFDGLAHLLTRRLKKELEGAEVDAASALEVFGRLEAGLRAIAFVTVGTYQDTQSRLQIELAKRLEEYGRTIAHELRTPLNSVVLEAELLARSGDADAEEKEEKLKHLELIKSAVRRIADLLDNVKTLAFLESARADGPLTRLETAFSIIVDELLATAGARDVHIEGKDFPSVELEAIAVQVALVNLLSNAIKYSDPDKEQRWVRVTASIEEDNVETPFCVVEVTDNGLGIPADLQSRIFQRQFRAHPERADGTGLGLAITRQVLQERGGDIEFESTPGEGSTFRFRLRAVPASPPGPGAGDRCPDDLMQQSIQALQEDAAELARTSEAACEEPASEEE